MGIPEFSWRLARRAEAATIAAMSRDLIEYGLAWRWTPARVAARIQAANVNVLVACARGKIVGFAIMRYGDDSAHLDLLAVAPFYRRTGVGRRLLQWLEKCAVVGGIFSIALEVRETNEGARLFYERMGYHRLAQLPGYYQGIEAALRMGRNLSCWSSDPNIQKEQQQAFRVERIFHKIFPGVPEQKNSLTPSNFLRLSRPFRTYRQ
jgi:ribosomal protein S18 acetylase RimI-like enzyme